MAKATTPTPVVETQEYSPSENPKSVEAVIDPVVQDIIDNIEITIKPISIHESLAAFETSVLASNHPFKSHMLQKIEEMKRYF